MDRVGPHLPRCLEDTLGTEVALARRGPADRHSLVGVAHMDGVAIGLGVHRDGPDPQLTAGAEHPSGDLSPIGNQDGANHRRSGRAGVPRQDVEGGYAPAVGGRGPPSQDDD